METRFNMGLVAPGAYEAMEGLDDFIATTSIPPLQQELIRIRASQINGCAYCVNMHTSDARKHGEPDTRMHLISVWREAGTIFNEEEKLLLAMTEEITLIHRQGLSDALYDKALAVWGKEKTAQVIITIIGINAWNRIGVALQMHPKI